MCSLLGCILYFFQFPTTASCWPSESQTLIQSKCVLRSTGDIYLVLENIKAVTNLIINLFENWDANKLDHFNN